MAYSLYQGSKLRKEYERSEGVEYDWVIVTRPDILFHKDFSVDQILDSYCTQISFSDFYSMYKMVYYIELFYGLVYKILDLED